MRISRSCLSWNICSGTPQGLLSRPSVSRAETGYIACVHSAASLAQRLHGHAYTIGPRLWNRVRPEPAPASVRWTRRIREGERDVQLSGLLSESPGANTLAIIMHGCGGNPGSPYAVRAARFLLAQGVSVLRLAWRGADLEGEDLYHA